MRTKIKINCINCGEEYERHAGRPNSKFCSRKCSAIYRHANDKTLGEKLTKKAHDQLRSGATAGDKHYKWKGGQRSTRGYVIINGKTKQREHIIVAERMIGRKLKANEVVHHINEIKSDNRPENLKVMDRGKHTVLHNKKIQ